jgi:surface carbohydrate biosynthesis protein (TIGR04326 family)
MNSIALNVTPDGNWAWYIINAGNSSNSLDVYVETHAERLRAKYLSFIADLSDFEYKSKSLANHFQLANGYNIWWMSLLAEKSVYKSPVIADCIKLLALEEILIDGRPASLTLHTNNSSISESIEILCNRLSIEFLSNRSQIKFSIKRMFNPRVLYLSLPHPFRAILFFLNHLILLVKTKKSRTPAWFNGPNAIFFFSYFIHLDQKKCSSGIFYSRQWEILPQVLQQYGIKCNWLHHFLKSDVAKDIFQGSKIVDTINENTLTNGTHALINSYSSFLSSWKVISVFFSILFKAPNKSIIKTAFNVRNSSVSFWPILKKEWNNSFYGSTAIQNLLWIYQMDEALKEMPKQKLGLYLQENQGWERALITAWKKNGHGSIIGIQHSSIRFWDLRCFDEQRIVLGSDKWSQPQPDFTAVNGPYPFESYLEAGYAKESMVCLEALRYLNYNKRNLDESIDGEAKNIIILGDILIESTKALLTKFDNIPKCWSSLTIKSHPGALIDVNDYPALHLSEERAALSTILSNFDIAIVVGSTTAALDSYLAGLKVIVFLMEGELNMSPLRGFDGVSFVRTEADLEKALDIFRESKLNSSTVDYFWSDKDLPRWRKLLDNYYRN